MARGVVEEVQVFQESQEWLTTAGNLQESHNLVTLLVYLRNVESVQHALARALFLLLLLS